MPERSIILPVAAIMSLAACGAGAAPGPAGEVGVRPTEPVARSFSGISSLTPEARSFISARVTPFAGQKSIAEIKPDFIGNILNEDVNGNGLSQADFYDSDREQASARKVQEIGQIFRSDYDGDGVVTKVEFDRTMERERLRHQRQFELTSARYPERVMQPNSFDGALLRAQTLFRNADSNGDDNITLVEAYLAPGEMDRTFEVNARSRRDAVFALDFNRDGMVTRAEVEAGIDLFVAEAKEAGVEFPASQPPPGQAPQSPSPPRPAAQSSAAQACNLVKPSRGATLIRLSAYEGQQLSDVALAGQDEETTTSEIRIEPGREPLFIVASSYESQIWRFTGAVERIEHVMLSSWQKTVFGAPAVGLTGVARQKVSTVGAQCIGGYYGSINAQALPDGLGRNANVTASIYGISGIALPSKTPYKLPTLRPGKLMSSRAGVDGAWQDFIRFNPAGVYTFNPAAIVTRAKAERYGVLPHQAGLVQLLIAGAIEPSGSGYIVRKPMRYPGSMGGAHSTNFTVPSGVPAPTGDPLHSCVRIAGKSAQGATCGSGR